MRALSSPRDLGLWSRILPWTYRLGQMDDFQAAKVERLRRRFKGVERQSEGSILYTTVGVGLCSWLGLDQSGGSIRIDYSLQCYRT